METEKSSQMEIDSVFEYLQSILHPLIDRYSNWECHPVERIVSQSDLEKCYAFGLLDIQYSNRCLFRLFTRRTVQNDNCQELVYNKMIIVILT